MAKKARKKTAAKRKKSRKTKAARRPARKVARKAAPKRKKRARKAKSLGDRISSAFRAVVGSVEDTGKMRVKMEQRGSDETQ
jgi:hypothetical protein